MLRSTPGPELTFMSTMVTTGYTASPVATAPHHVNPAASQQQRITPRQRSHDDDSDYFNQGDDADADDGEEDDEDAQVDDDHNAHKEMINETTVKSGYLCKRGEKRKTWKKRWFVLRSSKLSYYKNEKEYQLLRFVDLRDIKTVASVEFKKNENTFGIVTPKRTYYVRANTKAEMDSWIEALNDAKIQLAQSSTLTQELAALDMSQVPGGPLSPLTPQPQQSQLSQAPVSPSQERGQPATARPISIQIPGKGQYVSPAQPRPIPGANAFSPLTVTSESDAGAERYGLSYTSSTGQSMASSPGTRIDSSFQSIVQGGHSPSGHHSGSDASETGHYYRRGSQTFGGIPRQRSTSAGRKIPSSGTEPPASPGLSQGPGGVLSSSDEDEWDEEEGADRAMPLPGTTAAEPTEHQQQSQHQPVATPHAEGANYQLGTSVSSSTGSDFLKDPNKVITQGYLMKQSGRRKVWRKRWFVLTSTRLMYTRSHMDAKASRQVPISSILDAIEYESKKPQLTGPSSPSIGSPGSMPFSLPSFGAGAGSTSGEAEDAAAPSSVAGTPQVERIQPERRGSMVSSVARDVGLTGGSKKKKENCFKVITPQRTFLLCAPTEEEEIKWLSALKTLINRQRNAQPPAPATTPGIGMPRERAVSSASIATTQQQQQRSTSAS